MLEFKVDNQKLTRIDDEIIVNKSKNIVSVHFDFSDETIAFTEILVYFTSESNKNYVTLLKSDYTCVIPSEVMLKNYFKLSLTVGNRLTTNEVKVFMENSNYSENINKSDADTDVLFTLITDVNDLKYNMENHTHVSEDYEKLIKQLDGKADITDIPTKTSELINDSGFLTSHQDINSKEDKSNKVNVLSSVSTNEQYPSAKVVYDELMGKADVYHSHTIENITDLQDTLNNKIDETDLSVVAISGDYNDLTNKPPIPVKTSDLTNDSGFITNNSVDTEISNHNTSQSSHEDIRTILSSKINESSIVEYETLYEDVQDIIAEFKYDLTEAEASGDEDAWDNAFRQVLQNPLIADNPKIVSESGFIIMRLFDEWNNIEIDAQITELRELVEDISAGINTANNLVGE